MFFFLKFSLFFFSESVSPKSDCTFNIIINSIFLVLKKKTLMIYLVVFFLAGEGLGAAVRKHALGECYCLYAVPL